MTFPTRFLLVVLRLAIGWHFLFEGIEKLDSYFRGPAEGKAVWTSEHYLRESTGPLRGVFRAQAGDLNEALKKHQITWRSFRDKRAGKAAISDEWKILGYPTLYLIDHQGIIRQRWIGAPPAEELNRAVDALVAAAR